MKEKEGRRKSEENGNGVRPVWRGLDKGEEENRKRVGILKSSLFPVSHEWTDWLVAARGASLDGGLSFWKETVVNQRILL